MTADVKKLHDQALETLGKNREDYIPCPIKHSCVETKGWGDGKLKLKDSRGEKLHGYRRLLA